LNRALAATYAQVLLLPWIIFGIAEIFIGIWDVLFRSGQTVFGENLRAWLGICLLMDLLASAYALTNFFRYFRETAALRDRGPALTPQPAAVPAGKNLVKASPAPNHPLSGARQFHRRWIRRFGLSMAAVVVVLACWLGFRHHAAARQLEFKLARIRAARQPVTQAEFLQWLSLSSGAPATGSAIRPVRTMAVFMGPKFNYSKLQWPGRSSPLNLATQSFIEQWIATNYAALQLPTIRAGLEGRSLPIDWSAPPAAIGSQIGSLFGNVQAYRWEALWYLEKGKMTEAVELTQGLLAWAKLLSRPPVLEAVYLRTLILSIALDVSERMINSSALTEAQLRSLWAAFEEADRSTGPALQRAVIGQRCLDIAIFHSADVSWLNAGGTVPTGWPALVMGALVAARNVSGADEEELSYYLTAMEEHLRFAQTFSQQSDDGALAALLPPPRPRRDFLPWNRANLLLDPWAGLFARQVEQAARLRVTETALGVERFRVATGNLPHNLRQFTPEYLPRVPTDPFDGAPLRYRLIARGYVVYSIGADQKDDGGTESVSPGRASAGSDITFTVER
jgi:hypothetical protein